MGCAASTPAVDPDALHEHSPGKVEKAAPHDIGTSATGGAIQSAAPLGTVAQQQRRTTPEEKAFVLGIVAHALSVADAAPTSEIVNGKVMAAAKPAAVPKPADAKPQPAAAAATKAPASVPASTRLVQAATTSAGATGRVQAASLPTMISHQVARFVAASGEEADSVPAPAPAPTLAPAPTNALAPERSPEPTTNEATGSQVVVQSALLSTMISHQVPCFVAAA